VASLKSNVAVTAIPGWKLSSMVIINAMAASTTPNPPGMAVILAILAEKA